MELLTDNQSPLPRRLKVARKKKGIAQKNLGIMAGIDEFSASARMNQYEKGKHVPDYATSKRLAKIMDVPTAYLYEENDEMAEILVLLYQLDDAEKMLVKDKIMALLQTDT